jgi:flagellar hook-associated protein 3 FlgL
MTRISSYNQFFGAGAGIATGQANMVKAQAQASSQKVASDLKGFGQGSGALLSAKTYADRLDRRADTLNALQGRAEVEANALTNAVDAATQARAAIGNAVATQNSVGLRIALEQVLSIVGSSANAQFGGQAVFGGTWGYGDPFVTTSLDDMAAAGAAGADDYWVDTGETRTVMVGDNRPLQLSGTAQDIFRPLVDFVREIREWENTNTPFSGRLTLGQAAFVKSIMPNIAAIQSTLIDHQSNAGITAKII